MTPSEVKGEHDEMGGPTRYDAKPTSEKARSDRCLLTHFERSSGLIISINLQWTPQPIHLPFLPATIGQQNCSSLAEVTREP